VVAAILQRAGYYIGSDLNEPLDNLWFTLIFKWPGVLDLPSDEFGRLAAAFEARMTGADLPRGARSMMKRLVREDHQRATKGWLEQRARSFLDTSDGGSRGGPWGWKEPNTHVVIDRLVTCLPDDLRYVHVVRNGLDMALSQNQNQPRQWGQTFGKPYDDTPRTSLAFWRHAHERMGDFAHTMGDRFLFLRFEDLCARPTAEIERLLAFLDAQGGGNPADLARLVQTPSSVGRRRAVDLSAFDPADVEYVSQLGFPVD
jgi:hypothetical protein